jgi:hypothetical protein
LLSGFLEAMLPKWLARFSVASVLSVQVWSYW